MLCGAGRMKKLIDLTIPEEPADFDTALELATKANALQQLGAKLLDLSESDLLGVPMEESLRDAVMEARRLDNGKAIERQIQFIGRVMRNIDPAPIEQALALIAVGRGYGAQKSDEMTTWRERLFNEGDVALNELLQAHPQLPRQRLRQLARQAKKDGATSPAMRELQKLLREAVLGRL